MSIFHLVSIDEIVYEYPKSFKMTLYILAQKWLSPNVVK